MTTIVERLRIWPAADGADGLASHFVEALMREAADEIERLMADLATYSTDTESTENRIIDAEFAATEAKSEIE
jgi:hypothetical protein